MGTALVDSIAADLFTPALIAGAGNLAAGRLVSGRVGAATRLCVCYGAWWERGAAVWVLVLLLHWRKIAELAHHVVEVVAQGWIIRDLLIVVLSLARTLSAARVILLVCTMLSLLLCWRLVVEWQVATLGWWAWGWIALASFSRHRGQLRGVLARSNTGTALSGNQSSPAESTERYGGCVYGYRAERRSGEVRCQVEEMRPPRMRHCLASAIMRKSGGTVRRGSDTMARIRGNEVVDITDCCYGVDWRVLSSRASTFCRRGVTFMRSVWIYFFPSVVDFRPCATAPSHLAFTSPGDSMRLLVYIEHYS